MPNTSDPGAGGASAAGARTGSGTGSGSGAGSGSAASANTIAIDVEFTLVTPDKKRQVLFGLTKTVTDTDVLWTISFKLFERTDTTKAFPSDPDISLLVKVDPTLNAKAEQASKGMTPAQQAQATGPGAEAVKAANAGQLPQSIANKEVQKAVQ